VYVPAARPVVSAVSNTLNGVEPDPGDTDNQAASSETDTAAVDPSFVSTTTLSAGGAGSPSPALNDTAPRSTTNAGSDNTNDTVDVASTYPAADAVTVAVCVPAAKPDVSTPNDAVTGVEPDEGDTDNQPASSESVTFAVEASFVPTVTSGADTAPPTRPDNDTDPGDTVNVGTEFATVNAACNTSGPSLPVNDTVTVCGPSAN